MAKRPQISEELHEHVEAIHRECTGSAAGSFEEALETVTQLAENELTGKEGVELDWYPGKYVGKAAERLSSGQNTARGEGDDTLGDVMTGAPTRRGPEDAVVFKTRLGADRQITVPAVETEALRVDDEILQVVAYPVEGRDTG